jgi:hypothetical protein
MSTADYKRGYTTVGGFLWPIIVFALPKAGIAWRQGTLRWGVLGHAAAVLDSSESNNDARVGNLGSTSSTRLTQLRILLTMIIMPDVGRLQTLLGLVLLCCFVFSFPLTLLVFSLSLSLSLCRVLCISSSLIVCATLDIRLQPATKRSPSRYWFGLRRILNSLTGL